MATGSDNLDAVIGLFNSSFPIVVKHCSFFFLGAMNETKLQDAVDSTFVIVFLMPSILSLKKFIKSLLLNCVEIFSSRLFVNNDNNN